MIDWNWEVVDLDPTTWRNLGRFIEPGQYIRTARSHEHGLFVLHDGGAPLRAHDTQTGPRADLIGVRIDDPLTYAHSLYESGEWDRVHVIDKRHLAAIARQAQQLENRALTIDAYYRKVFELIWRNPAGYASVPPHPGAWQGFTYAQAQRLVAAVPGPATLVLGVLDGAALHIGLILEVRDGLIRRVTTFEALTLHGPLELSSQVFEHLTAQIGERFSPVVAALFCDLPTFEALLAAPDKRAALHTAVSSGRAYARLPQLKD